MAEPAALIAQVVPLLDQVTADASRGFAAARPELSRRLEQSVAGDPRLGSLVEAGGLALTFGPAPVHAAFWTSVFELKLAGLLVTTLGWMDTVHGARGIPGPCHPRLAGHWIRAVEEALPRAWAGPINDVYRWIARRREPWPELSPGTGAAVPAGRGEAMLPAFLDGLVNGLQLDCLHLAQAQVKSPADLGSFFTRVAAPALDQVGRLWQTGRITVAGQQRASAIARLTIDTLFPLLMPFQLRHGKVLIACPAREAHDLGARMLADLLGYEGWDVDFLGAGREDHEILGAIWQGCPHVLGLSLAVPFDLGQVRRLIARARQEPGFRGSKVIVGGNQIRNHPGLWRRLGADGHAPDARAAIRVLGRWWRTRTG